MIKNVLKAYFANNHDRSVKAVVNIFYSFFLKGGSIIIQFAIIPLTIGYLDKYQYGIWLTLASILGWFSFFDIGIGNGLRNKLAETLALKNYDLARIYISTSYAFLAIIFIPLLLIFWIINPYLSWSTILNAPVNLENDLSKLTFFVFSFFSLNFIFGLIGNVLFADQRPALNNLIGPLGNLLSLILILILKYTIPGTLFWVGIVYGGAPLVVIVFFNIYLFQSKYKNISPSLKYVNFNCLKDIMGLGIQFFVIQIAAIILFTTSNIMLTQFFGPDEVTSYNIAFKYFTAVSMVFGIILTPFWSAITEAYSSHDVLWIKSIMRKLDKIAIVFILISIVMFFICDTVYQIWVGPEVKVDKYVSLTLCLSVVITLFASPANTFINGVGKIRLQLISAVFTIIFTVPLAFLFCKILNWGPSGVILANLCTTLPTMFMWRIQYRKIIDGTAQGVWNR
jgi:O-antigen/teichoic acid export membrane protein